jgi:hypothetical protein
MKDVRRHVYEMARGWRDASEPIGGRKSSLGMRRRFDGVNVIVKGTDVHGVPREHALQRGDDSVVPAAGVPSAFQSFHA